ncbi:hypothetical protein [Alkalicoccus urumqiensis]|uniref:Uncharacterized protein n=1 Tax=Alkalicoccus urumqiensis TaxID=1548213 RepID=A0A2P6MIW3_ALKUR|nr:hypothetical protein [Alkalicoccus urumqiensis]PRO66212.1 hypothetical protein C6I21_05260 [Alkalicoccus urumqiensis]
MRDHIEAIVRETVRDFLQNEMKTPSVFALIEQFPRAGPAFSAHLKKLRETHELQTFTAQEADPDAMLKAPVVYLAAPKLGTAARLALSMDDNPLSEALIQRQLENRPIVFNRSFLPQSSGGRAGKIDEKITRYLHTMQQEGILVTTSALAPEAVTSAKKRLEEGRRLIREADVERAYELQETVNVYAGDVLSPLAADRARELGVTVQRKGGNEVW